MRAPTRPSPTQASLSESRAWFVDFASAFVMGLLTVAIVIASGGPAWAAAGFGIVVYLTRDTPHQKKAAS